MLSLRAALTGLLLASSLLACSTTGGASDEPPDLIVDGKADTWGYPTRHGTLFESVWQFGALVPEDNQTFPAWTFDLDAQADVTLTTRGSADVDLTTTQLFLYQQRETGTWKRIARSAPGPGFATLARSLAAGTYRVLVTGGMPDDAGRFMLQLGCTGEGCAQAPECLVGSTFNDTRTLVHGALIAQGRTRLTVDSELTEGMKAQIVAAVRESSHDDVTTWQEAFDRVDQNEVLRYRYYDTLVGRPLYAFEYGAGDNSYGAFFTAESATPVASIHDGDIEGCTLAPRACAFGQIKGDAATMPGMARTARREVTSLTAIDATLGAQLIASTAWAAPLTLAEAYGYVDEGTITVDELRHADGRAFTVVQFYAGDTAVGAFFAAGTSVPVAVINDGAVEACTAF